MKRTGSQDGKRQTKRLTSCDHEELNDPEEMDANQYEVMGEKAAHTANNDHIFNTRPDRLLKSKLGPALDLYTGTLFRKAISWQKNRVYLVCRIRALWPWPRSP